MYDAITVANVHKVNVKAQVAEGVVKLKYVPTKEQVADVLNKPLSRVNFEYF